MWPYPWTHVGTPSHLGHMDRVAATMSSEAHAGAAQEAPDIGQWEGHGVPLVRPSSCNVKGGIPSSRRYLPTYLLCAPKQLRHYHSPDNLSWDEWRLSDREVERIDLENAASPEEADQLEEMTADEMAVDGYYVVAGNARHEYKQGWKFLTLWDGYGLCEAIREPMSAFIQPGGSINPFFRSYLVENNEGQLVTRAETLSRRKKKK